MLISQLPDLTGGFAAHRETVVLAADVQQGIIHGVGVFLFWLLAVIIVCAGIGVVASRKPVYSGLCLAVVMICLAIDYAILSAPFLFVVQIIVYTGAVLMLFLFVVMLVGVHHIDRTKERVKGARIAGAIGFAAVLGLLSVTMLLGHFGAPIGLDEETARYGGEVQGLAALIFGPYVVVFESTSALLITAAVGAMILGHTERLEEPVNQKSVALKRLQHFGEKGAHTGSRANPGIYARSNSIANPALLPDGSVAESSVSTTLTKRDQVSDPEELKKATDHSYAEIDRQLDKGTNK